MNRPVSSASNKKVASFVLSVPGHSESFIRMSGKEAISGKSKFWELFNQGRKEISPLAFACRWIEDKQGFQRFPMKFIFGMEEKWPILSAPKGETLMPNTPQGLRNMGSGGQRFFTLLALWGSGVVSDSSSGICNSL
jgi:hypothetical protein